MKLAILGAATVLATLAVASTASAGECRDPWVTKAITQYTGHAPRGTYESLDCNYKLYGGGSWTTYDDLLGKVKTSYRDPQPAGIASNATGLAPAGASVGIAGGAGIAPGAASSMVAAGGGNGIAPRNASGMVAAGGGNGIAPRTGAGMVAAGGGN